jgi:hypothetical protein
MGTHFRKAIWLHLSHTYWAFHLVIFRFQAKQSLLTRTIIRITRDLVSLGPGHCPCSKQKYFFIYPTRLCSREDTSEQKQALQLQLTERIRKYSF